MEMLAILIAEMASQVYENLPNCILWCVQFITWKLYLNKVKNIFKERNKPKNFIAELELGVKVVATHQGAEV